MKRTHWTHLETGVGRLRLIADDDGWLLRIDFPGGRSLLEEDCVQSTRPFAEIVRQLKEYFAGKRTHFELPLAPRGTPFQLETWKELRKIPYGETITYGELARRLGKPNASRAVGAANGANPIPIVIPCHRVIGSDGALTGFGGGLDTKLKLLQLEGAMLV